MSPNASHVPPKRWIGVHYGGRTVAQGMSIAAGPNFDTPKQKRTDCGNVARTVLSKEVAVSDHWPCGEPLWRWRLSAPATSPSGWQAAVAPHAEKRWQATRRSEPDSFS